MAVLDRLKGPRPFTDWPGPALRAGSFSARLLFARDRRLEAATYLSSGFGLRAAIEAQRGWSPLGELADVWQPSRLKGVQVGPLDGTPFLAATQVFDFDPQPRKWLAVSKTTDAASRFVPQGAILVTCSGTVGRPILATAAHENILVSHDLLRVAPKDPALAGWLYAALHTPQLQAMAVGSQYGHIIKHLEPAHLAALPIPLIAPADAEIFARDSSHLLALRNRATTAMRQAEEAFERALGHPSLETPGPLGFPISAASTILRGRRRLEATHHDPRVRDLRDHLRSRGQGHSRLADDFDVWLPNRFRRVPAEDGIPLFESAHLAEVNPTLSKRIAPVPAADHAGGRVTTGWLMIARSGQVYGVLGTVALATSDHEGVIVSDDVLRIRPIRGRSNAPPMGYLAVTLSHPTLGRPLLKSLAYGSSIPHIDPADVANIEVVRLAPRQEVAIDSLACESASARSEADNLERDLATRAQAHIDAHIRRRGES